MESIWRQAPFLRLVIPIILGVTIGFYLPLDSALFKLIVATTLFCLAILAVFARKWKYHRYQMVFGVICGTAFIFAGASLALQERLNARASLILPDSGEAFIGQVAEYPQAKERSVSLLLKLKAKKENGELVLLNDIQIVSYSPHHLYLDTLIPGDLVVFSSIPQKHKPVTNPGQFDYDQYLLKNGIAGTVYFHENVYVERPKNRQFSLFSFLHEVQNSGVEIYESIGMEHRELGVASALILGKRSLIPSETNKAYAITGAVHVLSVSGLHVGIIYLVIISLLNKVLPGKKWARLTLTLTLFFLWFYAGITGFSPSVLRASVMFSFIAFGKHKGHKSNIYNTLAASAFLLIILSPSIVTNIGFQLSYLAVVGIAYFFNPIYKLFVFKNWLGDQIWALTVVSFGAQLTTFPLSIYYFSQFPNLSFFSNLVVIPLATLSLYAGLLTIVCNFVPFLNTVFGFALKWSLWILNTFIEWAANLPLALSDNLYFSLKVVVLIYILMILLVRFYYNPRKWNLWLPLIVIIILSATWVVRKISVARAVEICILEGSRESNLILRQGRNAMVFTRDTGEVQMRSNRYYLDGYFDRAGIDKVEWKLYDSKEMNNAFAIDNGVIFFNGSILSYWSSPASSGNSMMQKSDLIILSKGFKGSSDSLFHRGSTYIIDTSIPYYQRIKLIETFVKNKITFWDMHYQGAFFEIPKPPLTVEI